MKLMFELTMPNRGSWNGGWSGENDLYAVIRDYTSKKAIEKAQKALGNYHYSWSDGWGANVSVKQIDSTEARFVRKRSKGFCGYDWMINSILEYGKIYADHQKPENKI